MRRFVLYWYECPLVVLACESLHVCTLCIWRDEHARFRVEFFYAPYINFHSFIHSLNLTVDAADLTHDQHRWRQRGG